MPQNAREIVVEKLPEGGLLVIDPTAGRSHTLNAAAAVVWSAWTDGVRDLSELAARVAASTPLPADVGIVHAALAQLKDTGLVSDEIPTPSLESVARRRLLKVAAAAAFALPLIETIITPSPAAAQSGTPSPPPPPAPPNPAQG